MVLAPCHSDVAGGGSGEGGDRKGGEGRREEASPLMLG